MRIPTLSGVLRRLKAPFTPRPDPFLKNVSGVIHVGANTGQERDTYRKWGLRVIWVEPIAEVFHELKKNLAAYPKQRALQYLVTDRDNSEYTFHISNNEGASSSILDFKLHNEIWPEVSYERTVVMQSTTLPSLLQKEQVNHADYQALVLDTQGSELLVLKGAEPILGGFRYIKIEVPDFESYKDCCQLTDLEQFLHPRGFRELSRLKLAERPGGGNYYNIVYERAV